MTRRMLVAANWKMNGSLAANGAWAAHFAGRPVGGCDALVCAPAVYLAGLRGALAGSGIEVGAQDVSSEKPGAFTGETAGEMLLDLGVNWALVGHSERRARWGETDAIVAAKAARAIALRLRPVVCVGETLADRDAGRTLDAIAAQLDAVLASCSPAQLVTGAIAYEPVWAIGTGRTATPGQAQEVHAAIRARIAARDASAASALRVLYGGSVKADNAAGLFAQPDIDGALVGGASLVAQEFAAIMAAAESKRS